MHAPMTCEVRGNLLKLGGAILDNVDLVRLLDHARDQRLVLDLGDITFINSLGVRQWVRMQQRAQAAGIAIELLRVAEPLVHQLNIMPAARGVSIVTSFFAPYVCDNCDQEHAMLLDVRVHGAVIAQRRAPPMSCPDCKRAMELADAPDLYFMFLTG